MDKNLSSHRAWRESRVRIHVHVNVSGEREHSPRETHSPYNTRPLLRSISRFLRNKYFTTVGTRASPAPTDEWLRHPREPTGTRRPFAPLLEGQFCVTPIVHFVYTEFYEVRYILKEKYTGFVLVELWYETIQHYQLLDTVYKTENRLLFELHFIYA